MINIDTMLRRAVSGESRWTAGTANAVAEGLARKAFAKVDWDDESGEQWLRILDGDRVSALVSAKVPLIITRKSGFSDTGTPEEVAEVCVNDFDANELSASLEALTEVFGSPERFHILDPAGFSANDLWYATV